MHVSNDPIPKHKMRQFHEILCATGGRYTSNPRDCGDVMRVDYAAGRLQGAKRGVAQSEHRNKRSSQGSVVEACAAARVL
jgi:hypothetical protein